MSYLYDLHTHSTCSDGTLSPAALVALAEENGFTGSLIIAEFNSLADAEAWAKADPYVEQGVYASATVKPYKKVF